ncbi:MAG: type B 50S ribosomal protein L31 [Nitrospira sp.]|nr:type B 50S ribosomal protein L31 [Nitrospira sp.]
MKPGIHPAGYRPVVFHDVAIDKRWVMMSTVQTDLTTVWEDGRTYPMYKVETSMYSHPLYTGTQRIIDTEGRVEKFNKKYRGRGAAGGRRGDSAV